jgi:hypothetical protein
MEQNQTKIEVYCNVENKIVGHIDTSQMSGKQVLDRNTIMMSFTPISEAYQLSAIKDNEYLKCGNCYGTMALRGKVRTDESKESFETSGIAIIIGRTKLEVPR